ncbi:MAG: hypothetical protein J0G32_00480 [Alphaproteobacteria bacterium]|nr:hypothetical protein [Alphaproteobacteria bacterium]OJV17256.1 MAG: hypothetical protein BGO27_06255 [Alphaproteobacteria bacterium 33-17]
MDRCLISITIPTRRPSEMKALLESFKVNTDKPEDVELIVKIDDDIQDQYNFLDDKIAYPFVIKKIVSPRLYGYYTQWINNRLCYKSIDKDAYFAMLLTDEARFNKGWDSVIRRFKGFYPDDIFRLKLSHAKYLNYYNIGQPNYLPDCFYVITLKWFRIIDGFGDCWGTDVCLQTISFHLGKGINSYFYPSVQDPISRDIPVHEEVLHNIDIFGEAGQDIIFHSARTLLIYKEWKRNVSYEVQLLYVMQAKLTYLHIKAHEMNLSNFKIIQNASAKKLTLIDTVNNLALITVSYKFPKIVCLYYKLYFSYLSTGTLINLLLKKHSLEWLNIFKPRNIIRAPFKLAYNILAKTRLKSLFINNTNTIKGKVLYDTDEPVDLKPTLTLDKGDLFVLKKGKLLPSKFFKWIVDLHNYTKCSDKEFSENLDKAFENGYKTKI